MTGAPASRSTRCSSRSIAFVAIVSLSYFGVTNQGSINRSASSIVDAENGTP